MLNPIPSHRLPYEWETIGPALSPAMRQDRGRSTWDKLDLMFDPSVRFWRTTGGHIVTQQVGKTLWVLYAAGEGRSVAHMRELLALIEYQARQMRCREIRFEGRDWRRIARGYLSHRSDDGRYHFRKAL